MDDRLLKALRCQNTGRPPVWLMRQAGRYMAEYRALRQKYSFMEMCCHPDLITEVTWLPIRRFGLDAAILFSDILILAEALGLGLHFEEGVGPIIHRPIQSRQDIENLPSPHDLSALAFVEQGIKQLKSTLPVPLIGFCGAPFTVASYFIEGKTSRDFRKTKKWMLSDPESFHLLLQKLTDWSIAYLNQQIQAGVDAIQIFDSWAHVLAPVQFRQCTLHYLQQILNGLNRSDIPVIVFCRGSSVFASDLVQIKPSAISLDWNCDIARMRSIIPPSIAIQGNLDPDMLYAPQALLKQEVSRILEGMEGDPGFIFNLGHGILPDVPESAVETLVDCVKSFNKKQSSCLATLSF